MSTKDSSTSPKTSNPTGSAGINHFQREIARVVDYAVTEKIEHEMSAKALLADLISQQSREREPVSQEFLQKVGELVDSYKVLEKYVANKTSVLANLAAEIDEEKLDRSATQPLAIDVLQHEMDRINRYSAFFVVLSDIYELVRVASAMRNKHGGPSISKWVAPSSFERATSKYWIEPGRMPELLLAAVQEVPLLVYGESGCLTRDEDLKRTEGDKLWNMASTISSIYFDSPSMSLYNARVRRLEGAQLFRIRWYGKKPKGDELVFLELKTHHESWNTTKSVKERVNICENDVSKFLMNTAFSRSDAEVLVRSANPGIMESDEKKSVNLLLTIHDLIQEHGLRPCVRSKYKRVAFQSSVSNKLRITVDRDICLINERGTPRGQWSLDDSALTDKSIVQSPFDVLEIKLAGSEAPTSIGTLLNDGVIHDAAKFSKFLTGASAFSKVDMLPYWAGHRAFAPLLTNDIAKACGSSSHVPINSSTHLMSQPSHNDGPNSVAAVMTGTDKINEPGKGENTVPARNWMGLCRWRRSTPLIAWKKPSKVEPKTYFANERTLIQWLSGGVLIATVALLMHELNPDFQKIGLGLLGCAAGTILYSIYVYGRRVRMLASGQPYGYVDHVGPAILSLALFLGIVCVIGVVARHDRLNAAPSAPIRANHDLCVPHNLTGVSLFEYQPSDILPLLDNERIMVASLETVSVQSARGGVESLVTIPGADLEGLTSAGSYVYAVSETGYESNSELIELEWVSDELVLRRRWDISTPRAEGIAYIPGSPGKLFISGDRVKNAEALSDRGTIEMYDIPDDTSVFDIFQDALQGRQMNANLLNQGLIDSKIAALQYFEDVLYVLHDNDGLVRAWDMNGTLLSEWKLPTDSKQWEGMALERRPRSASENTPFLRRQRRESALGDDSVLWLHLAMDTPPQVWTFAVQEGQSRGEIVFPGCASA